MYVVPYVNMYYNYNPKSFVVVVQIWRERLLNFVLLCREVVKHGLQDEQLDQLQVSLFHTVKMATR
jgi:hypothetical protein